MKIKNLMVEKEFIDILINGLETKNMDYVLVDCKFYKELHFKDYIYRLFDFDKTTLTNNDHNESEFIVNYPKKQKKEQPGYKRLTKQDIKRSNKKTSKIWFKK